MRAGRAELKLDLDRPCQMCQEPTATQIFLMFFKQALSTQPKWSLFQIMMESYCSEFFQTWGKTAPERWPCSELIFSSFSYYPSKILDFKTRLLQLPAVAVWLMFTKKKKKGQGAFSGVQLRLELDLGRGRSCRKGALGKPLHGHSLGSPPQQRHPGWFNQLFVHFLFPGSSQEVFPDLQ